MTVDTAAQGYSQKKRTTQKKKFPNAAPRFAIDKKALKSLRLVAVAYSHVEREWFPTEEAYQAELEVENRARQVVEAIEALGVPAKAYPGDPYFFSNLQVDRPDLVLNLVDTLRGKDSLQSSVPGALELAGIPYTGAGMQGLVIGNDRNLMKQLLVSSEIPTPGFQFIRRKNTKIDESLGLPLIVKLNESGGSVGIDNAAVKETLEEAQERANELISTFHMPVVVEQFIDGPEITAVVFDDGQAKHVFLGQKVFKQKNDGKHYFTSAESYHDPTSYHYQPVKDEKLVKEINAYTVKAFSALQNKDYSKFDIRVDENTGTPYFTDCNPNTAFGPHVGLPFTEVLYTLYGVEFSTILASLLSKYAKKTQVKR